MLSKLKPSFISIFRLFISMPRRLARWVFKKLIGVIKRYPSVGNCLKRNLALFPKLESFLYTFYRQHISKTSHYLVPPKKLNITPSESAEKIYKQLLNLKEKNEHHH